MKEEEEEEEEGNVAISFYIGKTNQLKDVVNRIRVKEMAFALLGTDVRFHDLKFFWVKLSAANTIL